MILQRAIQIESNRPNSTESTSWTFSGGAHLVVGPEWLDTCTGHSMWMPSKSKPTKIIHNLSTTQLEAIFFATQAVSMQHRQDAKDRTVSVSECVWLEWPSGSGGAGLNLESEVLRMRRWLQDVTLTRRWCIYTLPNLNLPGNGAMVHVLMSLHFAQHLICLFGMIFSSSFIVLRELFWIPGKQWQQQSHLCSSPDDQPQTSLPASASKSNLPNPLTCMFLWAPVLQMRQEVRIHQQPLHVGTFQNLPSANLNKLAVCLKWLSGQNLLCPACSVNPCAYYYLGKYWHSIAAIHIIYMDLHMSIQCT